MLYKMASLQMVRYAQQKITLRNTNYPLVSITPRVNDLWLFKKAIISEEMNVMPVAESRFVQKCSNTIISYARPKGTTAYLYSIRVGIHNLLVPSIPTYR